jgi:hypothetical protein
MEVDTTAWSGDGDFTGELLQVLQGMPEIAGIKVEDAPASRTGEGYNFLANEIYITFTMTVREERVRWLGVLPRTRHIEVPAMTLATLERRLADMVGDADYSDEGMLQYLRTQRVVAPFQTRGYKLVEMVRLYQSRPGETAPRPNEWSDSGRD